jgi:hypothetical protein
MEFLYGRESIARQLDVRIEATPTIDGAEGR